MDSNRGAGAAQHDLERDLGFLIHDVARLLRRAFDRRVKRLGITRAQWFVLAYLHRKDGQRQRDLAEELDMEIAPLGKLLDRLEAGEWIRRRTDPDDRRVTRVYKTEKIDPYLTEMRSEAHQLYAAVMVRMSEGQKELFLDFLAGMRASLLEGEGGSNQRETGSVLTDLRRET